MPQAGGGVGSDRLWLELALGGLEHLSSRKINSVGKKLGVPHPEQPEPAKKRDKQAVR